LFICKKIKTHELALYIPLPSIFGYITNFKAGFRFHEVFQPQKGFHGRKRLKTSAIEERAESTEAVA
jgi:hypothetical protein